MFAPIRRSGHPAGLTAAAPKRRRWPWLVACVGLLAGGGCAYWFIWGPPAGAGAAEATTQLATASLQTLDKSVSATGVVSQAVNESVSFEASGTVLSVAVAEGDMVVEGQTLATIDTLRLEAARLQAEATLAQAEAALAQAEAGAAATTASDAAIAAAEARVEVAAADLAAAEANMADAVLTAPAAGQVTSVGVAVGDLVGASAATGGGADAGASGGASGLGGQVQGDTGSQTTAAFTIVGTESWSIDLTVSAGDLALLEVGGQAEITVDGIEDKVFGVISSLGRVASTSGGSAAFPVSVDITGQPEGLLDGLSATVALIYERRADVLTVPLSAIQTEDGASYVDKLVDGVATRTEVGLGETSGSLVEITSGLAEGDQVQITLAARADPADSETGDDSQGGFELPGGGQGAGPGGQGGGMGGMGGGMGGGEGGPPGGGFQPGGGGVPGG